MKKRIAAALSAVIMLLSTGCSKLEQEHFEKSLSLDKTGIALINADITYSVDPEVLFDGAADMTRKVSDIKDIEMDEDEFNASDFISEMRILFDENKKCEITISMTGLADFDKNYADTALYAGLNGITLNCGKMFSRGNAAYYDKRFAYTMCAFTALIQSSDMDELNGKLTELDKLFGDKKYLCIAFDGLESEDMPSSFFKELSRKYYISAKDLLKGFDTGCVTRIENGTRFELTSKDFTSVSKHFASYLKKNKKETADLINEYLTDSFALNAAMAGSEASYLADMAQMFKITPANIAETADGYNALLGEAEYKAFMEAFDISFAEDITEKDGVKRSEATYAVAANGKNAVEMKAIQTAEKAAKAEFENIDKNSCIDYADYAKLLSERSVYDYDEPFDPEIYEGYAYDEDTEDPAETDSGDFDTTAFKA